jgi:hypothetical protein
MLLGATAREAGMQQLQMANHRELSLWKYSASRKLFRFGGIDQILNILSCCAHIFRIDILKRNLQK